MCSTSNNIKISPDGKIIIGLQDKTIKEISIPEGVEIIGREAFNCCESLETVSLPDSIRIIEYRAFFGCSSLQDINIPEGLLMVGMAAFRGTPWINNPEYVFDNIIYIGKVAYCPISDSIEHCRIKEGTISIAEGAFRGCKCLSAIDLPSSVNKIGSYAFGDCKSLETLVIPFGIKTIEAFLFLDCTCLRNIEIPNDVEKIEGCAFSGCRSLQSIVIPESVTYIGNSAFDGCSSLACIKIPNNIKEIDNWTFRNCSSLSEIEFSDSLEIIGEHAFENTPFIKNPELVKSGVIYVGKIAYKASNMEIKDCCLLDDTVCISSFAFEGCSKLESIKVPDSIKYIGIKVFEGCTSLKTINIPENIIIKIDPFSMMYDFNHIFLPEKIKETYIYLGVPVVKKKKKMKSLITNEENDYNESYEEPFGGYESYEDWTILEAYDGDSSLQYNND